MRVFLVLLMLTLLPLQFYAAAVAECHGHIALFRGVQAHAQQPTSMMAQPCMVELRDSGAGLDLECGACHSNCAAAVTATTAPLADPSGIERVEYLVKFLLPPWHERPYRPKWSALQVLGLNAFA